MSVRGNAIEFLNAYQRRHARMLSRRPSGGMSQAYWNWRSAWLTECLRHCADWAKHEPTLQCGGYQAIGDEYVQPTRSVL